MPEPRTRFLMPGELRRPPQATAKGLKRGTSAGQFSRQAVAPISPACHENCDSRLPANRPIGRILPRNALSPPGSFAPHGRDGLGAQSPTAQQVRADTWGWFGVNRKLVGPAKFDIESLQINYLNRQSPNQQEILLTAFQKISIFHCLQFCLEKPGSNTPSMQFLLSQEENFPVKETELPD